MLALYCTLAVGTTERFQEAHTQLYESKNEMKPRKGGGGREKESRDFSSALRTTYIGKGKGKQLMTATNIFCLY